ncbi:hypothetical protein FISHEDRAFT_59188 [Fistulina hepatica ATCC 64428]|uniref:Uncharacterized protein n=1 Tax=Fistulina hepatica ATCC 64428 TaxID=1128425 RepID=A0A0D7ACB6_9AGAR|nr:hypothetical protein FISHEDRAFT_59188 [Fistulina hepatica ATCC 64428]
MTMDQKSNYEDNKWEEPLLPQFAHLPVRTSVPRRSFPKFLAVFLGLFAAAFLCIVHVPVPFFGMSRMRAAEFHIPPDVVLVDCPSMSIDKSGTLATASFNYSVAAGEIFFVSRGGMSTGSVDVIPVEDTSDSDILEVDVRLRFSPPDLLRHVKVCRVRRADHEGHVGLGIFTERYRRHYEHHGFEVTVRVPPGLINALSTDMPLFKHHIDDLGESVLFESLSLRTSNMHIHVDSVAATSAVIETSNSAITGSYETSSSLELLTANAPIKVDVLMVHKGGEASNLSLHTSNAVISSSTMLEDRTGSGGKFTVAAHTVNGRIDMPFPSAPVNSRLKLKAETVIGSVSATMHPTYQGAFRASTYLARADVISNDVEDLEGKGRTRNVEITRLSGSFVQGFVSWSEEGRDYGEVELIAGLGRVTINI